MLPYCDFDEQVSVSTDDGRLRPDLIVRLPGEKVVIVDAKVPLAAYLDACEATDDAERTRHLESHARQVREHMSKLSAKSYWQQFGDTPSYVVMFLPDEGFFRAALGAGSFAASRQRVRSRVHVASPTTLIVLLQSIAHGWQQESVAEDAREVLALGRELYERVGVMGGHLTKMGNSLKGAVGAFNDTVGSLEKRLLPTARKLEGYIVSDKELPELAPVAEQPQAVQAPELGEQLRADRQPPSSAESRRSRRRDRDPGDARRRARRHRARASGARRCRARRPAAPSSSRRAGRSSRSRPRGRTRGSGTRPSDTRLVEQRLDAPVGRGLERVSPTPPSPASPCRPPRASARPPLPRVPPATPRRRA